MVPSSHAIASRDCILGTLLASDDRRLESSDLRDLLKIALVGTLGTDRVRLGCLGPVSDIQPESNR